MGPIPGMDPFHEQLARVALDAAGRFGFALAGGYAIQAHGFRHHQVKQALGWHVHQPEPGTLTWTTPHGRNYTVRPAKYRV